VVAHDTKGAMTSGDIWMFTVKLNDNKPPVSPFNPNPKNFSIVDKREIALSWQCYDPDGDPLTYDVYFGKEDGRLELVAIDIDTREYVINGLDDKSTYRWKVVAKDDREGESEGEIWSFVTKLGDDDIMKDLLAYYPFDGDAKDSGPNHYNGQVVKAVAGKDRFDRYGKSLFFGRGHEYVELPNPRAFAFKGSFTIAYWIKPSLELSITSNTHISVICKTNLQNNRWFSGFTTKLGPEFWVNDQYMGYDYIKLNNLKWNHIAVVFRKNTRGDKGFYTLYLNGMQVGDSKLLPAPTNEANNVIIGNYPEHSSFGGWLDDIYFYNRALSGNEINELIKQN
jgi:hypothetical protein